MNHILTEMLNRYQTESLTDRKNAVKEIMQEIEAFCRTITKEAKTDET